MRGLSIKSDTIAAPRAIVCELDGDRETSVDAPACEISSNSVQKFIENTAVVLEEDRSLLRSLGRGLWSFLELEKLGNWWRCYLL